MELEMIIRAVLFTLVMSRRRIPDLSSSRAHARGSNYQISNDNEFQFRGVIRKREKEEEEEEENCLGSTIPRNSLAKSVKIWQRLSANKHTHTADAEAPVSFIK